ncbi:hypothetical protein B0H14DRAFT_2675308 [Mycena olivaceomarginata]|nr:hypothetical protein B0H14DRAFT_2675308 [Mycena olivaceomarginata]
MRMQRWSRIQRRNSALMGGISGELALRRGMREDVDEDILGPLVFDVVRLCATVMKERSCFDGAHLPSRTRALHRPLDVLAWPFAGKVSRHWVEDDVVHRRSGRSLTCSRLGALGSLVHDALQNLVDETVLVRDISVRVDQLRCDQVLDSSPNHVAREPTR